MSQIVELLWFSDCANNAAARAMLEEVIAEVAPGTLIRDIDATDPMTATNVRYPGSPTIRVDGCDVDPGYVDPGDYTPLSSVPNERRAARPAGAQLDRERARREGPPRHEAVTARTVALAIYGMP